MVKTMARQPYGTRFLKSRGGSLGWSLAPFGFVLVKHNQEWGTVWLERYDTWRLIRAV